MRVRVCERLSVCAYICECVCGLNVWELNISDEDGWLRLDTLL